jgi:aminoglycoside phosphotransferase (APT) family kinase protein
MSAAAIELTRLIQGLDDLCAELDRLAGSSLEGAVVHGDIRWDNVMAVPRAGSCKWTKLQVIDWEHCRTGDPADDVGAFLGEYLRTWAQSVPIWDPVHPGRPLVVAGRPLGRMRPAVRAFWESYAQNSAAPPHELDAVLRHAVGLAAVRLLTAALEEAQVLDRLRTRVLCLVSLSRNLLCRRGDAPSRLLGLAADRARV